MMNIASRTRAATRRWSLIPQPHHQPPRIRSSVRNPPVMWNIQGMRGQMSTNCLWHACRAFTAGLLIFLTGVAMCVAGFHADGILNFGDESNNTTEVDNDIYTSQTLHRDPSRPLVKFSKLSYVGPFVMGVGGFIIVATCVMTFEARDSAAKVGPAALFGTSNSPSSNTTIAPLIVPPSPPLSHSIVKSPREVRSIGCQTGYSFSNSTLQLFDKRYIMDAFRKFSKTLRSSTSITSSGQGGGGSIHRRCSNEFHRSPSAPSLLNPNLPVRSGTTKKYLVRARGPRVPPALRQAMSMDYSSNRPPTSSSSYLERNTTSTQTLTVPGTHTTGGPIVSPHSSRLSLLQPKGIYRNLYSTSSENYPMRSLASVDAGDSCSSTPQQASFIIEDESEFINNTNASVLSPPPSESTNGHGHLLTNGGLTPTSTLSVLKPSFSGGSASSLRTLSPHASYYSDDSFDRGSVHSEQLLPKSPTPCKSRSSSYRSTDSSCRPSLMRQTRVDYSEIIVIADSEDEILPVEDLTTIPE